jgi:hypothetical protein
MGLATPASAFPRSVVLAVETAIDIRTMFLGERGVGTGVRDCTIITLPISYTSPTSTLQVSSFPAEEPRAPNVVAIGFQEFLPLLSVVSLPPHPHVLQTAVGICPFPVTGLFKRVIENCNSLILSQIEAHAPNKKYSLVTQVVHVGVALLVCILDERFARVVDVQTSRTGWGFVYLRNKGAVGVRVKFAGKDGVLGETLT